MAFPFVPPTVLAPMEGLTTPALRALLATRGGIGLLSTEFVRVHARTVIERLGEAVVPVPRVPLSVQLMGAEPEALAAAARRLVDAGADVIDLNVGCPTRRAARGGVGAELLRDPQHLGRVVSALRSVIPGLLSVKLRAGIDDSAGSLSLGRLLVDAGIDFLSVHPRLRVDGYGGVADWRVIAELAQALPVPVVGNGDVWYAADAARMRHETGCSAVMLGRPALRNPWIFRQIADLAAGQSPFRPDGAALVAHLLELHHSLALTAANRRPRPLGALKEHLGWLTRALPDGGAFRRRALRLESEASLLALVEGELGPLGPDALDLDAVGRYRLERSGGLAYDSGS